MNAQIDNNIRRTRRLAYAGLVPLYTLTLLAWHDSCRSWALTGIAAFAAIAVTFVGALHWGRSFAHFADGNQFPTLLFGSMPAVLAWFAMLLPLELSLPMLSAVLMFVWGTEQMLFADILPAWYRHLRHQLTAATVIAILIGWAATIAPML